jgi:hypothetical protein
MSERPAGVTILGFLWIIIGLFLLFSGIIGGTVTSCTGIPGLGDTIGIFIFIIGVVDLILGIGCFMAWPWVWMVGVLFSAVSILTGLASLVTNGLIALIGIIIAVIILYYLYQPGVKRYFGKT